MFNDFIEYNIKQLENLKFDLFTVYKNNGVVSILTSQGLLKSFIQPTTIPLPKFMWYCNRPRLQGMKISI